MFIYSTSLYKGQLFEMDKFSGHKVSFKCMEGSTVYIYCLCISHILIKAQVYDT